MVNESSGISSAGSNLLDERKPLTTQRQQSSVSTDTQLPVNKTQTVTATQAEQVQKTPDTASPTQAATKLADETMRDAQQDIKADNGVLAADELRDMLDDINNALYSMNKSLKFEIHDKTEDLIVRVINTRTDEVIRQYPSEEVLERKERLLQGETSAFSTRVD